MIRFAVVAALLLGPVRAPAQEELVERALRAAPGLEVAAWARAPLVANPASIDVDERGRLWVAEAVNYRRFNAGKEAPPARPGGDRIVILEDTDGDGRADRSTVFAQDEDLVSPLGVAVLGERVVVACSPHLLVYTRDGQDRVVRKERLLSGWGGLDHDHGLHRFSAGPDGRWYGNAGNAGPHLVTDRSGWTLRAGSWYTGGSPHNSKNAPGLLSDDGRLWHGGIAVRVEPDGRRLTPIGHGFRNPYGLCIDSFGDLWTNDNDDTQSCRTGWLLRYGDAGYDSKDGSRSWQADRRPWQSVPVAHWRQEDPGVIPPGHVYGNGAPTGIAYYENGALGAAYDGGLLLSCEAGQNVVWGYRRVPEGAGYRLEGFPFLTSTGVQDQKYVWHQANSDPRTWFRPSAVAVGPDGAVYVADWFDPVVGGHQTRDRHAQGSVYRIAPRGSPVRAPVPDDSTLEGLTALLCSPAPAARYRGYLGLVAAGPGAEPALRAILARPDRFLRARAVWILGRLGADLASLLSDADPEIRVCALRALQQRNPDALLDPAAGFATDPSPAVRRELALVLRDAPAARRVPILAALARRLEADDRWGIEALGLGAEGVEEALYAALLPAGPARAWSPVFAALAWRLHPPAAVPALLDRAIDATLSFEERAGSLDALAFIRGREAAVAMKEAVGRAPADLRDRAAWWLANRAGNDWKAHGVRPAVKIAGVELPGEPRWSSSPGASAELRLQGARRLFLVLRGAGRGAWTGPVLLRGSAAPVPLASLPCAGGPPEGAPDLAVKGDSVLVYEVHGDEILRFGTRAETPEGGTLRFQVHHDGPPEGEIAAALGRKLLNPAVTLEARRVAAAELARTPAGGALLANLALERRLPEEFAAQAAEDLRKNPDLSVRALAGRAFPRTSASGKPLPPIDALAAMPADAGRGRAVFFGETAGCSRCHRAGAEGRDVGPDLSLIGEKFDRRGLLDAVLNPSAAILAGYEAQLLLLESGETVTGFVSAEDAASVTLRPVEGAPRSIPRTSIARRRILDLSLMPDNAALGLDAGQIADLVAFLASLSRRR